MVTINNFSNGIFNVSGNKVSIDFVYDGGWYKGELAIFNLTGMEELEVGSTEFIQEAANRALSNSELGYVVVQDQTDRARFSDTENELAWEGQFNGGLYRGEQSFAMNEGDNFAMMLVTNGTVSDLAASPDDEEVLFSFSTSETSNGETIGQIADLTGNGDTFGWEDVDINNLEKVDRDYNDFVVQVQGATANAGNIEDWIYKNRDWLNTEIGQEILSYANRALFNTGTFSVSSTGQVEFDYLYDGGAYQGELGFFSLKGMRDYEPGSVEYLAEASKRVLSNSEWGRILISDYNEGAKFSENAAWEEDYNVDSDSYLGVKSFEMETMDELAFMLVQDTTIQDIYLHPHKASQNHNRVIFSTDSNQFAAVDNNGTFAFEDIASSSFHYDADFNDFIFQVRGLDSSNTLNMDDVVNPYRDWRSSENRQALLEYAERTVFSEGVFEVGETGEVTFDYLYDGGMYQGEIAVFSLTGMELLEPGSEDFIAEATRRAITNSELGYVLAKDKTEGAKFSEELDWEQDYNTDAESYQGVKNFTMTPGDQFAVMLVQHTSVWEITDPTKIHQWGKLPLFSIPEANPGETKFEVQMLDVDGNGTYAFEDIPNNEEESDTDYNDFVFQIKGAEGVVASMDYYSNSDRDWRKSDLNQEILEYTNRASFDQGIFQVGDSGEVSFDYLYDGGFYGDTKVGVFSLDGMDIYGAGSEAFMAEMVNRVNSDSTQGYTVIADSIEKAKYSADLRWEGNFNQDDAEHQGKKTFLMNPGDNIALVLLPDGDFDEILTAPDWKIKNDPLFSINTLNRNNHIHTADILTSNQGTIIGFEDGNLNVETHKDYNDIVLAIEGVQTIGLDSVEDVMAHNRNWLEEEIGIEILDYFA